MNELDYIETSIRWLIGKKISIPDDILQGLKQIGLINDKKMSPEQAEEKKKFQNFAKRRIKENKYIEILEYEFQYLDIDQQKELIEEYTAMAMIKKLEEAVG